MLQQVEKKIQGIQLKVQEGGKIQFAETTSIAVTKIAHTRREVQSVNTIN